MNITALKNSVRNNCESNGNATTKQYMGTSTPASSDPQYTNDNVLMNLLLGIVGVALTPNTEVRDGGIIGASITLETTPTSMLGVFANGAFITQGVDYSVVGTLMTFITDQSGKKLIIIYKY